MLKQSLVAVVLLGGLAAAAGAESEVKTEDVKQLEAVQPEIGKDVGVRNELLFRQFEVVHEHFVDRLNNL